MILSELYPEPQKLIENEAATLRFLKDNPYFQEEHPQFAKAAGVVHGQVSPSLKRFSFESHFNVEHDGRHLRLFLGGKILPQGTAPQAYSEITYSLAVCRPRGERISLLRKYHFDVALPTSRPRQAQLLFHVQYCGTLSPYLCQQGLTNAQVDQMHSWLSEPRLFYWPMSLALLVDAVLHEFSDIKSAKFRRRGEWRDIVRVNERLLLGPFCQKCADIISDRLRERQLLADVFDVG